MARITLRVRTVFCLAAVAAIVVQLGAIGSAFASSAGQGAGGARGAPGSLAGHMRTPDTNNATFAGYSVQGGGEGTFTVTANIVVPKLTCSSGPEQAIAPSVGVYNISSNFSAASLSWVVTRARRSTTPVL
jgi:hypothetical protein